MSAAPMKCLFMMKAPVSRDARRFSCLILWLIEVQ
jgi:hypothetical protein